MDINTPAGKFAVPKWEAERLTVMSDNELRAAVKVGGMVDPFALTEALKRGVWQDERPARGCTMADHFKRMGVK